MLDQAKKGERLDSWCKRNGINLGKATPDIIGYWCRCSGISVDDESKARKYTRKEIGTAKSAWCDADVDIKDEISMGLQ